MSKVRAARRASFARNGHLTRPRKARAGPHPFYQVGQLVAFLGHVLGTLRRMPSRPPAPRRVDRGRTSASGRCAVRTRRVSVGGARGRGLTGPLR